MSWVGARITERPARLTIDIDLLVFDREFIEDDLWSQALPGSTRCRTAARPVLPVDGRVRVARGHSPRRLFADQAPPGNLRRITSDRDVPDQPNFPRLGPGLHDESDCLASNPTAEATNPHTAHALTSITIC